MLVLGLHLGHDATACVMSDGHILSMIEKERLVRVKHAGFMNIDLIETALECAGVGIDEIDFVAVTQTQNWPTVFFDKRHFYFEVDCKRGHELNVGSAGERMLTNLVKRQQDQKSFVIDRFNKIFLKNPSKTDGYAPFLTDKFDTESEHTEVLYSCEFHFPKLFIESINSTHYFN